MFNGSCLNLKTLLLTLLTSWLNLISPVVDLSDIIHSITCEVFSPKMFCSKLASMPDFQLAGNKGDEGTIDTMMKPSDF